MSVTSSEIFSLDEPPMLLPSILAPSRVPTFAVFPEVPRAFLFSISLFPIKGEGSWLFFFCFCAPFPALPDEELERSDGVDGIAGNLTISFNGGERRTS